MVKKYIDLSKVELSNEVEQYLKAKKTKGTQVTYRGCLKRFRKFYDRPITEFFKEIDTQREKNKKLPPVERRRYFEETINDFVEWMQDLGYANNPIRGSLTALQNLLKYYDIPISYAFVKIPPPISKKTNHKHKWKIEEIKEFVAGAKSYRDKAIIMLMFQSGMAVGEICNLDYGDMIRELNSGELPLLIDVVREKNANEFKALIGADAVTYLKLYLGTRVNLDKKSPLFAKEGTEKRVTEGAIQMRLRELADKVFGIDEGKMNPYRPHSLRSAFRSRLTGKTDGDLIKFWMGDVLGPKAGAYLNLPDEEHRALYKAIEHRLSIETTSEDVMVGRIGELKDIDKEYRDRLTGLEGGQKALIKSLTERDEEIEQLHGEVKQLRRDVAFKWGEMKSMIEQLERELNIEIWDQVESKEEVETSDDAEAEVQMKEEV